MPPTLRHLAQAPAELTAGKLRRLGEGIGKVVYASEHWVVKRARSERAILALILIWKVGRRWLSAEPTRRLQLMRIALQALLWLVPRRLWRATRVGRIWREYTERDRMGERLASERMPGTGDLPETVAFPPARVRIGGWPGWLTVAEATERVECTLHERLEKLAGEQRWVEVELWLERLILFRERGWRRGLFSVDAHLKNYGVVANRVVLIDVGGLTDHWEDIEENLEGSEEARAPHRRLSLGEILTPVPELAARFDERWRAAVHTDTVWQAWPKPDDH